MESRIVAFLFVGNRSELTKQGGEAKLGKQIAQGGNVRLLNLQRFEIERDRRVGWNCGQLFAESYKLAAFLQRFSVACAFHFARALQSLFSAAKLLDQLPGTDFADTGFAALGGG